MGGKYRLPQKINQKEIIQPIKEITQSMPKGDSDKQVSNNFIYFFSELTK